MTRHVLKNNEVQLAGSFQLNMDDNAPTRRTVPQPNAGSVEVRIKETHPEYALVEVACSCGQVTLVRCEYAPVDTASMPVGAAQG